MSCMAKKISTKPFGGEIPPELADEFDKLVDEQGWAKKRAITAALRSFLSMSLDDQKQEYSKAHLARCEWIEIIRQPASPDQQFMPNIELSRAAVAKAKERLQLAQKWARESLAAVKAQRLGTDADRMELGVSTARGQKRSAKETG